MGGPQCVAAHQVQGGEGSVRAAPTAHCSSGCGSLCRTAQKYCPSSLRRQSPRPQIYHGLHRSTSLPRKDCGDPATQTEARPKHAAVQVSGCRECLSLLLPGEGSGNSTCVRCEQVEDLLSMVAELKEEVERLRTIRESEQEIDWWSNSQACQRGRRQG